MSKQTHELNQLNDSTVVLDEETLARFESAPVSGDQRRSYRYPAQGGREEATVQRSGRTWKGKLREESAGGMALEMDHKVNLKINDEVEVGIYTGWYRARVIHVQEIDDHQIVGFQRISVISTETDDKGKQRRKDVPTASQQVRNLIAVACVAMAIGVGFTSLMGGAFGKQEKAGVRSSIPAHYADRPPNERLRGVLDGVNILMEPEVARGLGLSKEQQESIEGVMVGASNSLSQAYEDSQDEPPEVWYGKSQDVVNQALENILGSLTDEQVLKWRALIQHRRGRENST